MRGSQREHSPFAAGVVGVFRNTPTKKLKLIFTEMLPQTKFRKLESSPVKCGFWDNCHDEWANTPNFSSLTPKSLPPRLIERLVLPGSNRLCHHIAHRRRLNNTFHNTPP